jgi:putative membrane protein
MALASAVIAGLVAALHVYFLVLEMFLWTGPVGQRVFGRTAAEQETSKVLAANQGLYNGFLAAGLVWSIIGGSNLEFSVRMFFLGCVVLAGVYGGLTAARRILFVQACPAVLGMAVTWLSH